MHGDDFLHDERLFYDSQGKKYPLHTAGGVGSHLCRHRGEHIFGRKDARVIVDEMDEVQVGENRVDSKKRLKIVLREDGYWAVKFA